MILEIDFEVRVEACHRQERIQTMASSRFLPELVEISDAAARFEEWLAAEQYELAVECCPYESAEGGYQGATDAWELLDEYLPDHPEEEAFLDELQEHAAELGPMSNLWNREEEPELAPDDEEEETDW